MNKIIFGFAVILIIAAQHNYGQISLPIDDLFLFEKSYIVNLDNPNAGNKDIDFLIKSKEIMKAIKNRASLLKRKQQHVYISKDRSLGKNSFTIFLGNKEIDTLESKVLKNIDIILSEKSLLIKDRQYSLPEHSITIRTFNNSIFASKSSPVSDIFNVEPGEYIIRKNKSIVEKGSFSSTGENRFVLIEEKQAIQILPVNDESSAKLKFNKNNELFQKAVNYFNHRNHEEAQLLFERMERDEPENPFVMTYLARIYFRLGKYEKALSHSGSNIPWAVLNKGRSMIMLEMYEEGENILLNFINNRNSTTDNIEPIKRIASFWLQKPYLSNEEYVSQSTFAFIQGKLRDKAIIIEEMKKKLALDPGNFTLHYGLGFIYWLSGDIPYALRNEAELAEILASNNDELSKAKMLKLYGLYSSINDLWRLPMIPSDTRSLEFQEKYFRTEMKQLANELINMNISEKSKKEIRRIAEID